MGSDILSLKKQEGERHLFIDFEKLWKITLFDNFKLFLSELRDVKDL